MLLQPFDTKEDNSIASLLSDAGIGRRPRSQFDKTKNRKEQFLTALDDNGVDFDKMAKGIRESIEDDKTRLPATRLALEASGLLDSKEKAQPTEINISIVNSSGTEPGNLINLIMPVERISE